MLYVNDVELKPDQPQWERYQKFLDDVLPHLDDVVIFKKSTPIRFNDTKLVEVDPIVFVPYEAIDYDERFGSQHWRFCLSAPRKNKDGKWVYKPLGKEFKRTWAIDKKKQPDRIFFMLYLCHKTKDGTIICEDKKVEARKSIAKDERFIGVKFMINNELSPLSPKSTGSEDLLRMIAAAWGVSKAHSKRKSIDEVRLELFGIVDDNERKHDTSGRGFDTFMSEIKSISRITLRANIQRAADNKIIVYDSNDFTWKYTSNDHVITTISARFFNNPATGLFDYFLRQEAKKVIFYETLDDKYTPKDEWAMLDKVGEEPKQEVKEETKPVEETPVEEKATEEHVEKEPVFTEEQLQNLDGVAYMILQRGAKEMGLQFIGVKKVELIESIQGKLAAEKKLVEA